MQVSPLFKVVYGMKLNTHTHTHTHRAWLQDDQMSPKLCWNHKNVKTSIKLVVDNDGAKAVEENSPQ